MFNTAIKMNLLIIYPFTRLASPLRGWIARFLRRMAALQRLGMEQPFRVVVPCPAPQKPHAPPRPTKVSRFKRLLLMVCFLLWGVAAQAAPVILVFGDSLSASYGIPANKGWVSLLEQRIQQKKSGYRVVNASISGETTSGGRYRIEQVLTEHRPAVVILELGANDGLRGLAIDATASNLDAIIAACLKRKARVLLIGMRLPPNYGRAYASKFQAIYPQMAQRHKIPLLPFLLEGFADNRELFQADGLHPATTAQPLIMERVWKVLQPLLATSE
jgi:acyl-CoA thioesterase-1